MKKYKQLIIGIIIGVVVASIVPVGAAIEGYVLKKSPHKLVVNGEYWQEDTLPMMIYQDGYNYIPAATFRTICENMNIPFAWDGEKEEIQIGETKQGDGETMSEPVLLEIVNTEVPEGEWSRSNYEINTEKKIENYHFEYGDVAVYNGNIYIHIGIYNLATDMEILTVPPTNHTLRKYKDCQYDYYHENLNDVVDMSRPPISYLNISKIPCLLELDNIKELQQLLN
jgi:hypothetical protein